MVGMTLSYNLTHGKNLGDQAYQILRHAILTFQFEPGQTIHEVDLAQSMNISRTPIRDAVHALIAEGLIEVLPQRTKQVTLISKKRVTESAFVRMSLERSAFYLVAEQWEETPAYLRAERELTAILDEQKFAAEQQDMEQFLETDEAFHQKLLQLTNNQTLLRVVYLMRGHLDRFRFLAMRELDISKQLINEHQQILESIKTNQQDQITCLLEKHMGNQEKQFIQLQTSFAAFFTE